MSDYQKQLISPIITGRPDTVQPGGKAGTKPSAVPGKSFEELLQQTIQQSSQPQALTFSKHAQSRTEQRGIALSETDMDRLSQAVGKAEDKGLGDTLVLMDNTAFIVNVPSRVVITVVDSSEKEHNVFTNIDGAVII